MKTFIAAASLAFVVFATPVFAQVNNASMIGNYVVTGTETDGSKYDDGTLAITMDRNGALELKWDGGKYVGMGQVVGNQLAVASVAEGKIVIGIMDIKGDGSLEGKYWRRTDPGTGGTEVWKKR